MKRERRRRAPLTKFTLLSTECSATRARRCKQREKRHSADNGWSDDLDTYITGNLLGGQGPWETWDQDPGVNAFVTDFQTATAPNSFSWREIITMGSL